MHSAQSGIKTSVKIKLWQWWCLCSLCGKVLSHWSAAHAKPHNIIKIETKEGKQHINKQHSVWQNPRVKHDSAEKHKVHRTAVTIRL